MSFQPTGTQNIAGNSQKRRRFEEDVPQQQDPNNVGLGDDSDDDEDGSSDGDLTHEEIMERKRRKAANAKVLTQIRHRDEGIGKIAGSHPAPKAATPLARAIHEFTRMVMGIPRKARGSSALESAGLAKLPDPPTDDERNAWLTRRQVREQFIRDAQDKAMRRYIKKKPIGFKPNSKQKRTVEKDAAEMATLMNPMRPVVFTSRILSNARSRYPHHFAAQCEGSLAMAGFPRCTFDWEASYDTPWNSTTATIILSHWVKAYNANGARDYGILVQDNTAANREEVLRRWCGNKGTKYRQQSRNVELIKTPEGRKKLDDNISIAQRMANKRRNKEKIYQARVATGVRLFGQDSAEVAMLSHPEIHSDNELVVSNSSCSRQKLRLEWRSAGLDTLINLLDQAHWKRKRIPKDIRQAKALVDRGVYAPEADKDRYPPKGFQMSLVSPVWYDSQEGLLLDELDLNEGNPVDINNAIQGVMQSFRSRASLAAEEAAGSSLGNTMTQS